MSKLSNADIQALLANGNIKRCPVCDELSAHAWQDATAYDEFQDGTIPGGFKPEPGTIAHIPASSCWEWECGHCRAHLVEADSPINHPAYTHSLDS